MKKNSLTIILIIIIVLLLGYIIYDKFVPNKEANNNFEKKQITITDSISLDYVDIYLTNDGYAYLVPLKEEKINNLNVGNNLKERLETLYNRAFYFDVYVNNYKIKGFRVQLDNDILKIRKVILNDIIYIVFIKENNTIGIFNYDDYINMLNTQVSDNFNNIKNVLDIVDNKIVYLDGSKKTFNLEK